MLGDARENVGEPGLRIDVIHLGGDDQAVHHRGTLYASIAGSLLAMMNGFVNPDQAGFQHSVELVTMVVLGGLGSIVGSVVGAAVLVVLPQVLTVFQEYENLMLGLIIIVSMVFMRDGIVPMARKLIARTL